VFKERTGFTPAAFRKGHAISGQVDEPVGEDRHPKSR
jgi:hypothetical protein